MILKAELEAEILIQHSMMNILRKMDEKEFIYKFCRKIAKIICKY